MMIGSRLVASAYNFGDCSLYYKTVASNLTPRVLVAFLSTASIHFCTVCTAVHVSVSGVPGSKYVNLFEVLLLVSPCDF